MKNFLLTILALAFSFTLSNCSKNDDGLTNEIKNLVPEHIIDEMKSLGMPIYGGKNPPNIESIFVASPFVLLNSNRENDTPGDTYSDAYFKFFNQDNKNLTISMDYKNGGESGNSMGSYLVGDGSHFSVFVEVNNEISGDRAKMVFVISGEKTEDGIKGLHFANFMLDNYGNENGYWIENGEGRVIYDSDGFSPVTASFGRISFATGSDTASAK